MAMYKNLFKITHNDVLPIQGRILISEPFLQDAYFQRSVILLVEHSKEETFGFVLNKKTDLIVNSFFPELKDFPEIPIYIGGPVESNRLFFLHTLGDLIIPNAIRINKHLFFDGDFEILKEYITKGHSIEGKVKFFLGYSGWGKGQLNNEITQNSWVVSDDMQLDILQEEGEDCWKRALQSLGSKYETWTKYPKNPFLN